MFCCTNIQQHGCLIFISRIFSCFDGKKEGVVNTVCSIDNKCWVISEGEGNRREISAGYITHLAANAPNCWSPQQQCDRPPLG